VVEVGEVLLTKEEEIVSPPSLLSAAVAAAVVTVLACKAKQCQSPSLLVAEELAGKRFFC